MYIRLHERSKLQEKKIKLKNQIEDIEMPSQ